MANVAVRELDEDALTGVVVNHSFLQRVDKRRERRGRAGESGREREREGERGRARESEGEKSKANDDRGGWERRE